MNKKCFEVVESPYNPSKFVISPIHDNFYLKSTSGSFNVICARLMNLSYANYLRVCRDVYDAEIIGKGTLYPVAYFNDKLKVNQLCKLLNARANQVLWDKEHEMSYEEMKELVDKETKMQKEKAKLYMERNNGSYN